MPNVRVLNELSKKEIIIPKEFKKYIDTNYIKNIFLKEADINFSKSKPRNKNPIYFLKYKNINMEIQNFKDSNKIKIIHYNKKNSI